MPATRSPVRPPDPPAPPDVVHVTSAEVAALLQKREHVLWLRRFMGEGATVADVAREAGRELHVVYRFARRLERLGVLRVAREQKRAGRPQKVYVCPARRFFIPRGLCSLEESFAHEFAPVLQRLQRNLALVFEDGPGGAKGVLVGDLPADNWILAASADGVPWPSETWGPTPDSPPAVAVVHELRLDYDRAKAFSADLFALVERYRGEADGGPYDFLLMMAPRRA